MLDYFAMAGVQFPAREYITHATGFPSGVPPPPPSGGDGSRGKLMEAEEKNKGGIFPHGSSYHETVT